MKKEKKRKEERKKELRINRRIVYVLLRDHIRNVFEGRICAIDLRTSDSRRTLARSFNTLRHVHRNSCPYEIVLF